MQGNEPLPPWDFCSQLRLEQPPKQKWRPRQQVTKKQLGLGLFVANLLSGLRWQKQR